MSASDKTSHENPVLPRSRARGPFPTATERAREDLVADFFGVAQRPETLAGMHPQAKRLTKFVDAFLDKLQGPKDRILSTVQAHWVEISHGDESILKLRAVHFARNTLTLEVPDATTLFVFRQPRLTNLLLSHLSEFAPEVRQLRMVMKGR